MGIIKAIDNFFFAATQMYEHTDLEKYSEEESLQFFWNYEMYHILGILQAIDVYFGMKGFWTLHQGIFPEALKGEKEWHYRGYASSPQTKNLIWEAWREGLYEKVLDGEPGILAEIEYDDVAWFANLLNKAYYDGIALDYVLGEKTNKVHRAKERETFDRLRRDAPWNEGLPGAADPENSRFPRETQSATPDESTN